MQHVDTVWYIRGCAEIGHVDTTIYSIWSADTLKRLSPHPRTFGKVMVDAVRADMSRGLVSRAVNLDADANADVPGTSKWPCDASPAGAFNPAAAVGKAMTVLKSQTGPEYRYHGDTTWYVRDTNLTRTVYRSDSVFRTAYVNDRMTSSLIMKVAGDTMHVIERRDASGRILPLSAEEYGTTFQALSTDRALIMLQIRTAEMTARLANSAYPIASRDAPENPTDVRRYALSANLNLVQHGDTVRYIRGCAAIGKADTTIYRILSADSLRRVSPNPRMFGPLMVTAVRADMRNVIVRSVVLNDGSNYDGIPGPKKWPCDNQKP